MCSGGTGVSAGFGVGLGGTTSWGQFIRVLMATISAIAMADAAAATTVASTVMSHHACLEFV